MTPPRFDYSLPESIDLKVDELLKLNSPQEVLKSIMESVSKQGVSREKLIDYMVSNHPNSLLVDLDVPRLKNLAVTKTLLSKGYAVAFDRALGIYPAFCRHYKGKKIHPHSNSVSILK